VRFPILLETRLAQSATVPLIPMQHVSPSTTPPARREQPRNLSTRVRRSSRSARATPPAGAAIDRLDDEIGKLAPEPSCPGPILSALRSWLRDDDHPYGGQRCTAGVLQRLIRCDRTFNGVHCPNGRVCRITLTHRHPSAPGYNTDNTPATSSLCSIINARTTPAASGTVAANWFESASRRIASRRGFWSTTRRSTWR
jgi:hypothetical protein